MFSKRILTLAAAAAIAMGGVKPAAADLHGLLLGGAIAGAIINQNQNANRNRQRTNNYNAAAAATRTANREVQTALNYFGFPAGTPDGVVGRRTRAAVSSYQTFLEFPATGNLTELERNILVAAHQRGMAGSYETQQLIGRDPMGVKALLLEQKDMMLGGGQRRSAGYPGLPIEVSDAVDEIAASSDPSAEQLLQRSGFIQLTDLNGDGKNDYILDTSFSGSSFWCNPAQCKTIVFASTAQGYARNDLLAANPVPATFECRGSSCVVRNPVISASNQAQGQPADPGTTQAQTLPQTLPVFAAPSTRSSLASHCNKVNLLTNANGGFTTVDTMTDVNVVVNEQFCLARTFAIEIGERRARDLGVTEDQIVAQCGAYGPVLKPYVRSISLKPRAEVIRDLGGFVLNSGIEPDQLKLTAEICMSQGYRTDDLDMAMGAALLMVVLGEGAYNELLGHHLITGRGASERSDLALAWYQSGLDATAGGGTRVFAPTLDGRDALMQQAVFDMQNSDQAAAPAPAAEPQGTLTSLPTFAPVD